MPGHHHTSPGWYPEPDIVPGAGGTLRYWDGQGWTDRRRPRPILTSLDLGGIDGTGRPLAIEGPVRALELPAPAAEITAGREAPAGRTGTRDQPIEDTAAGEPPTASGGSWEGPAEPPPGNGGGGGGSADDSGSSQSDASTKRRRKWWLLCGIAVLGALVVGLAGRAMRPAGPGPRVLTDPTFVRLANADCTATLPNLRPPYGGPLGSAVNATQAADQIDKAADGMDSLIGRLGALPAAEPDRPHIAGWLDGWHRFVVSGHDYATFLRQHGANQKNPPAVLDSAAALARGADNFARANGLNRCLLTYVYVASPSDM